MMQHLYKLTTPQSTAVQSRSKYLTEKGDGIKQANLGQKIGVLRNQISKNQKTAQPLNSNKKLASYEPE